MFYFTYLRKLDKHGAVVKIVLFNVSDTSLPRIVTAWAVARLFYPRQISYVQEKAEPLFRCHSEDKRAACHRSEMETTQEGREIERGEMYISEKELLIYINVSVIVAFHDTIP